MTRPRLSHVLVVLAVVAMALALLVGYVVRAGVNSDQFSNRAAAALRDPSVKALVAEKITDDLVLANASDLLAARPIIESVTEDIVGARPFTELFGKAVRDVHRAVFDREQATVTLTVADVGTVVAAALEQLRPSLAKKVDAAGDIELMRRDIGGVSAKAARAATRVRHLAWLLFGLTIVLVAAAIAFADDRRRAVVRLGVGAAVAGIVLAVALRVARSVAIDAVAGPDERAAARGVWDAFLADLHRWTWILAGSGAVVAASAASLIRPRPLGEPLRVVASRLAVEPQHPALRVLRGAAFAVAGVVVILARDAVLALATTLLGVYLVYEGISAVLAVVYRPQEHPHVERPARRDRRRHVAIALPVVLIGAVVAAFVGGGGTTTAAPPAGACDGHRSLCDRTLPEVVLPATHNSMSVPLPGWYSAEQDAPIADQLEDGIRGLLVDTHYADKLPNGKLRTVLAPGETTSDGVSQDTFDAAMRIRDRLGFAGQGERGMYLCHSFCELGGTPLASALDDIHDFLVTHPGEIVVLINQDYVTPADFVGAVRDAGLGDLVYKGPVSGEWPTLREMVSDDQRLLLLAENHAGAAPWYHLAYQHITEETPYAFPTVAKLIGKANLATGCEPNRGPEEAPLFLINHWVTTDPLPRPTDASRVNAYDPLLQRVRDCRRIRRHLPTLVAVNFYRRGDLFRVVDTLNGVGAK